QGRGRRRGYPARHRIRRPRGGPSRGRRQAPRGCGPIRRPRGHQRREAAVLNDESFTASTPDNAVFVRVAVGGHTLGVQIEPEAMQLPAHMIADRIMACNDVAYLTGQLVIRAELQRVAIPVDDMPTEHDLAAAVRTLEAM